MKRFYFIIIPLLFIVLSSCKKTEPEVIPMIDPRDKFLGTWKATDSFTESNGTIVTQTYTFSIEKSLEDSTILMRGFANLGGPDSRGVIKGNNFEIVIETITVNNMTKLFDAIGNLQNEKLSYQYRFITPGTGSTLYYNGSAVK